MITPIQNIGPTPDAAKLRAATETAVPTAAAVAASEARKASEKAVEKTPDAKEEKPENDKKVGDLRQPVPAYDLRLTVEKDPETGEVVFKSINRLTGEVVKQMPNAEIMAMKRREHYQTGAIFVTDV